MNDRIEIGSWASIAVDNENIGAYLNCGELGIEAYDADDVLLGAFANEDEADNAIFDHWERKRWSNGGVSTLEPDPAPGDGNLTYLPRGMFGIEAFDNGVSLGLFPDREAAVSGWRAAKPSAAGNGGDPQSMLAARLDYAAERGWELFPADLKDGVKKSHKAAKHSKGAAWGKTRDPEKIRQDFRRWPNAGIGLPTGRDNGFWVFETDTPEGHDVDGEASMAALEQKHGKLPDTLMAESPSGSKHRYYKHPGNGIKVISRGLPGYPGVDIKGDGGMVIAPPSVRKDGTYRWLNDHPIADAPQWLIDLVTSTLRPTLRSKGKSADGAEKLSRFKSAPECKDFPPAPPPIDVPKIPPQPFGPIKEGCAWLREAFETGGADQSEPLWKLALNVGVFLQEGEQLIHTLSEKYDGYDFEATEAKFERARQDQQDKNLGWPRCATIKDNGATQCLSCPHLKLDKSPLNLAWLAANAPPTTIRIVGGQIARTVDEAEDALLAVATAAPIMVRAGKLVQPIVDLLPASHGRKTEVVLLRALTAANLIYLLNKHAATFIKFDGRAKKWLKVDPTPAIATQLLEKGRWQFPKVAGVINSPTLRPDGTILDSPGYDPATQLWYHPDSALMRLQLCAAPTREQAKQALKLLNELLTGYPFDSNVDRSVALAAILTQVLRGAFDVVPMILLRAPDAGSGKSHLVDLISIIARGQLCPVVTDVKSVEEMEKRLGALVLEGAPMASLDNCSNDIGGNLLCQITERRLIFIRILGVSQMPACEWRGVLYATGIHVGLRRDMTRRGLTANLDAKVERPELREFDFDPIERVLADRGSYIAAAIAIARAYITAGAPKVCGPLGSYGQWSRLVRSSLIWLGEEDPTKSMDEARKEDPMRRAEQDLITIWRTQLGAGATTAATLTVKASQQQQDRSGLVHPHLHELLLQQAKGPHGDIDTQRVGSWLMSIRGRVYDGHCIERVKEGKAHGNMYALVKPQKRTSGSSGSEDDKL